MPPCSIRTGTPASSITVSLVRSFRTVRSRCPALHRPDVGRHRERPFQRGGVERVRFRDLPGFGRTPDEPSLRRVRAAHFRRQGDPRRLRHPETRARPRSPRPRRRSRSSRAAARAPAGRNPATAGSPSPRRRTSPPLASGASRPARLRSITERTVFPPSGRFATVTRAVPSTPPSITTRYSEEPWRRRSARGIISAPAAPPPIHRKGACRCRRA